MKPRFIPHSYQRDIIRFIEDTPRCAVWAGMGTGKTASTLMALDHLSLVEGNIFPALVLAPLRVAKSTWPDEVAKWEDFKHLRVSVVSGSVGERERALADKAEIYTMNYDNLIWLTSELIDHWPFKTVIADEFTRLKNYRTRQGGRRSRALAEVAHRDVTRFIGLTGTPSPNGLSDLWGQTWFLDKGARLGRSFSAFEGRWFTRGWDGYSVKPTPYAQEEIEDRLRDICLTVPGLPVDEPIFNTIEVDLPLKARATYNEMERDMFVMIDKFGVDAPNAATQCGKLQQLANGAIYVDDDHNWAEVHRAKLEALESIVEEAAGAPVLVSYNFRSDLSRLKAAFPQAQVLDADPDTIKRWNAGKIPILLAHPKSAGHGLNLAEGGNILAFFSVDWNLEEHLQIIERIGPMRQKQAGLNRPVFVHMICAKNTVDFMVLERLQTKRNRQDILLAALKRHAL
jgi:SNF2 family DNA or RNA helicase